MTELLTPQELDDRFSFPKGRSARLARKGLLPIITLPDGSIRFAAHDINRCIRAWRSLPVDTLTDSGAQDEPKGPAHA